MKAPLGPRFIACVVDYVLFLCLIWSYFGVFGEPTVSGGYSLSGSVVLLFPFLWVFWFVLPEWYFSASFGKKLMRLRVCTTSGKLPSFWAVLLRRLLDLIDFAASSGIVALVCYCSTEKGQRLGDLAASTVVVEER